jgi:hypothetical protein
LNDLGDYVYLYDENMSLILMYTYGEEAGYGQSITRDPDITGPEPLVKHTLADGSGGALFSPGTKVDGSTFPGCSGGG